MVDEDAPQAPLAHHTRPPPDGRADAVERVKDPMGRPAVVGEQEADLFCSHACHPRVHRIVILV